MASLAELQRLEFQKMCSKVTFPSINNSSWVVQSRIKVRYIPLIQENALNTQNVCVRHIENILLVSEVKVFTKKPHKVASSAKS